MRLSNQALTCVMMALQKSLMEQSDIVPVLLSFDMELDDNNELIVLNPPTEIVVGKQAQSEDF